MSVKSGQAQALVATRPRVTVNRPERGHGVRHAITGAWSSQARPIVCDVVRMETRRAVLGMFERFTDGARRVVDLAQDEARRRNTNFIGTEDILLGLIGEGEGVAAKALVSLGIGLTAVRQEVEKLLGPGLNPTSGDIPFAPRGKRVLELAQR